MAYYMYIVLVYDGVANAHYVQYNIYNYMYWYVLDSCQLGIIVSHTWLSLPCGQLFQHRQPAGTKHQSL